jgi:hypothetical protein
VFGRSSRNFRGKGNVWTIHEFFAKLIIFEKTKVKFCQVGEIPCFRENKKSHFRFNPISDADPDDVDCHSGGLKLIYVPDAVDPELCSVVDDCHSGGLLLIYVPDAVDPKLMYLMLLILSSVPSLMTATVADCC